LNLANKWPQVSGTSKHTMRIREIVDGQNSAETKRIVHRMYIY
jgi:hypothetical protein